MCLCVCVAKHYKKDFFTSFLFLFVCTLLFKVHNHMNKHNEPQRPTKQTRRRSHYKQNSASSVSFNNINVVSKTKKQETSKNSFHHPTDSDVETETTVVRPWAPSSNILNETSSSDQYNNNNDNSNSPSLTLAFRSLFEMITEDLDKFVYTPAPNGLGDVQCRITRDKRGVERGLFPTYYMHVERPGDGKKVGH